MADPTAAHTRPPASSYGTFLLQMAGRSGSGKSTVAGQIAAHTGAVVVDMDILKSTALDVGVEWDLSGKLAYQCSWAVADALLDQGFNVILDSPCRFEWIVNETTAIAQRHSAAYCFIECVMPDLEELGRRIRSRPRRRSQMVDAGVSSPDAPGTSSIVNQLQARDTSAWAARYPTSPWLQIDTRESPERCLARALAYLDQRRTH